VLACAFARERGESEKINERILFELHREDSSAQQRARLSTWILHTKHADLLKSAFRLLELEGANKPELFAHIDSCDSGAPISPYLEYLSSATPSAAPAVLEYLLNRARYKRFSQKDWDRLYASTNPWVCAIAFVVLPNTLDSKRAEVLFAKTAKIKQPLPAEISSRLFAELQSDSFRVRERAMTELIGHGEQR